MKYRNEGFFTLWCSFEFTKLLKWSFDLVTAPDNANCWFVWLFSFNFLLFFLFFFLFYFSIQQSCKMDGKRIDRLLLIDGKTVRMPNLLLFLYLYWIWTKIATLIDEIIFYLFWFGIYINYFPKKILFCWSNCFWIALIKLLFNYFCKIYLKFKRHLFRRWF